MTLPDPAEWPVADPLDGTDAGADLLERRAAATPDATALVDAETGRARTYAEFDRRVDALAASVRALAPSAVERVGTLLSTRPAFADAYFATARCGATLVPLNVELTDEQLADQAERAGLDRLLCGAETAERATAVAPRDAVVASVDEPSPDGVTDLEAGGTGDDLDQCDRRDERLVMSTSGTTGRPKGVRLTLGNLVASAVGSAERLGVDPGDRWLVCLPMYHMGGLAPLVRSTLYGTAVVLQPEFDVDATPRVIEETGVTAVSLVPTMLARLLDSGWSPPERLRFVLLGGGPASEELIERCRERAVPVYPTYGLTETASQVATAAPDEAADYPGTVGRPLRTASVSIDTDVAVRDQSPAGAGEIVVDGPVVTPGYLDAAATEAAIDDRGLHTGDLGYLEEGRLWVLGRVDDVIVTGGENVRAERVASVLRDHPSVAEAVVVGVPDEEWGERVAALVVADGDLTDETLRRYARERLPGFAVPKTIRLVDALPRTASGTVDRERARERLD